MAARIERLSGPAAVAAADPLMREYLEWTVDRFTTDLGVDVGDRTAMVDKHHQAFRDELPKILDRRGRLLVTTVDGNPVAVGSFKPVDAATVEIKRMYVRPRARGMGIGRALLQQLLSEAGSLGYRTARLETAVFMTEAQALYRSMGFRDMPMFDGEARGAGLEAYIHFMERPLVPEYRLRPASAADAEAVAEIWRAGWADGHLGNVPEALVAIRTPESFRTRAAERVGDTTVAVAGDGGEVAGFVMVVGDEVEQVYVSAAHRGGGVAGLLLAEAERQVAAAGHERAWLAVVAGNARARRFYERCGWADEGPFDYDAEDSSGTIPVPARRYVKRFRG